MDRFENREVIDCWRAITRENRWSLLSRQKNVIRLHAGHKATLKTLLEPDHYPILTSDEVFSV